MLALAEEYQVTKCIKYCKWMLWKMKKQQLPILFANEELEMSRINAAGVCFKILSTAVVYGYTDIEDEITTNLARIGANVYTCTYKQCDITPHGFISAFSDSLVDDPWSDCYVCYDLEEHEEARERVRVLFKALPAETQLQLLQKRLRHIEDKRIIPLK